MSADEEKAIENIRILAEYMGDNYFFSKQGIRDLRNDLDTVLNLIKKQQEEIEELKEYKMLFNEANERKYRKRYLKERRKEEPNLLYPDFDEIYKRYYEQQKEIEKLKKESRKRK